MMTELFTGLFNDLLGIFVKQNEAAAA